MVHARRSRSSVLGAIRDEVEMDVDDPTAQGKGDGDAAAAEADEALQRWQRTAVAAFFRAEARGFAPGRELDDWLAAERELDALSALAVPPATEAQAADDTPRAAEPVRKPRKAAAKSAAAAKTAGGKKAATVKRAARGRRVESGMEVDNGGIA
jgi:hypothetical protein